MTLAQCEVKTEPATHTHIASFVDLHSCRFARRNLRDVQRALDSWNLELSHRRRFNEFRRASPPISVECSGEALRYFGLAAKALPLVGCSGPRDLVSGPFLTARSC